jgi:hypothetical protein
MGNYITYEQNIQNSHAFFGNEKLNPDPKSSENPQHNLFNFDEISFDSRFEGGNLMYADKVNPGEYNLWITPDCFKTSFETGHRVSFYFKAGNINLQGFPSRTITFRIMNMDELEYQNYQEGMVPVYLSQNNNSIWHYIPTTLTELNKVNDKTIEVSFQYTFNSLDSQKGVYFAFTFPYTYSDSQRFLDQTEKSYALHPSIYLHRELLTYSPEGKRIDLLTITSHDSYSQNPTAPYILEPMIPGLFPTHVVPLMEPPLLSNRHVHRPYVFRNKGYILLSARVHAAESPANFMLQSFIQNLLKQNDPVSQALLQNFVFVIVPMINPDGVSRGHYRTDLKGRDLNRTYEQAISNPEEFPGPYAVLQLAKSFSTDKRLAMYIDFHAHSNKNSGFLLGAYHQDAETMAEIRLFARLFDMYSKNFDFNCCEFGAPEDAHEKAGIAKNAVRNLTGIVHSYTLEAGYHKSTKDFYRYSPQHNTNQDLTKAVSRRVGIPEFFEMGDTIRHAILETLLRYHPNSILPSTWYGDVNNLRSKILQNLVQAPEIMELMEKIKEARITRESGEQEGHGQDVGM